MESTTRYLELCRQGQAAFRSQAAPAALVRVCAEPLRTPQHPSRTVGVAAIDDDEDTTMVMDPSQPFQAVRVEEKPEVQVFPLSKKPGAPFSDMITVGRTANNDVVLNDVTVSRFHAYFKQRMSDKGWIVCDAGSKNGSSVDGAELEGRKETEIASGSTLMLGDVQATFYTVDDLFNFLQTAS